MSETLPRRMNNAVGGDWSGSATSAQRNTEEARLEELYYAADSRRLEGDILTASCTLVQESDFVSFSFKDLNELKDGVGQVIGLHGNIANVAIYGAIRSIDGPPSWFTEDN